MMIPDTINDTSNKFRKWWETSNYLTLNNLERRNEIIQTEN